MVHHNEKSLERKKKSMKPQQLGMIIVAVAVIGIGFFAMRPGQSDVGSKKAESAAKTDSAKAKARVDASRSNAANIDATSKDGSTSDASEVSRIPTLGAGKMQTIAVRKGEEVEFSASSDIEEEVHVHGYDIARDIPAGGTVDVNFKATQTGVFEIEFHKADVQVAKLKVMP